MSYFSKFPKYLTHIDVDTQIIMTDFFRRIRTGKEFSDLTVGLTPYIITEGETIEGLAYKYYGSAFYHWIIILVNNMVDIRQEWPLEDSELISMMLQKYNNINTTHHWELDGFIVDEGTSNAIPVTNYEYEYELNEQKRTIRLVDPVHVQQFIAAFDALIKK